MTRYAERLKAAFGSDFTLAITTIGVISYLTEATVIDMLGLTDPLIAKHPEQIPGLTSTWKERKFNNTYLLSRDPDVIMFSTGLKPSAPAEKALFLHSKFRGNYYLYYLRDINGHVYKRKGDFAGVDEVYPDPTFVDLYSQAIHLGPTEKRYQACLDKLDQMLEVMPEDFSRAYEFIGTVHFWMGNTEEAKAYARRAIEMDEYSIEAHSVLHDIYLAEGDREAAKREESIIARYNPEIIQGGGPAPHGHGAEGSPVGP
jgi:tetratricopeptide (TPR) repeat protein